MTGKDSFLLEREVEARLEKRVKALGGLCLKFLPDYARGMPDRLVLLPGGVLFWAETKRPRGGRLDSAQLVRHAQLRRLGQRVEVLWDFDSIDRVLPPACAHKKDTPPKSFGA